MMSKAEKTREFIIQKSAPIFNIKGYENTSLTDIQEATKLTKGAIYGNFLDKNELAIAAFQYNTSLIFNRISKIINSTSSSAEALIGYGDYYSQKWQGVFKVGGCPMLNAAVEADDNLFFLREYVRRSFKNFIELLTATIEKGQTNGEFKKEVNAEEYAALIHSIVEGNILLSKIMNEPKYLHLAAARIRHIVEQELKA
ncbi:MAG: TetR/AcrR family transcriptional regulator [Chryseobacterium culicis]|jgi:TetR/AcrR family transcriptional repressor of nem operon